MLKKISRVLPIAITLLASLFSFSPAKSEPINGLNVEVYTINSMGGAYDAKPRQDWQLCSTGWTYSPNIEANWGGGIVANCRGDFVAVHYSGWIHYTGPEDGATVVRFDNISDDGFILDIDNQRVINDWNLHGCTGRTGSFVFENNIWYQLDAWFFEWGGGACNTLYWTVGNNRTVVPSSAYSTNKADPTVRCWDGAMVYDQKECSEEPQIPCWNGTVVHYQDECPIQPYLNAPKNLQVNVKNGNVYLKWDAPDPSDTTTVEHYAVMFSTSTINGWGISVSELEAVLDQSMFMSTGGLDQLYSFMIRADNDSSGIYSAYSDPVQVFIDAPHVTCWNGDVVYEQSFCSPEPKPEVECWDGSMVFVSDECPVEPTPSPTPTEPTETPTPTATESTPEPTNSDNQTQSPEPTISPSETVVPPSDGPSPSPSTVDPEPSFSESPTTQPTLIAPTKTPSPSESVTNITPDVLPNDTTEEKVNELIENLQPGEAVSAEAFAESGLDYEDLPPDTPIELPNGVVLTAEIADAIEIFESPAEILNTVFKNPGKALKALGNVGADLPPKKRKKAQQAVFPMIIVGQIAASTTMTLMQRRVGR